MLGFLGSLFSTGGVVKSVENIAKEWIDTPQEKAKASALMIKTLDPNGLMRRQISQTVSGMYVMYIIVMMTLVISQSYGFGDAEGTKQAIESLKELFVPITTSFTAIVGASFGVNGINSYKAK
jgi:hypothetical protein